MAAKVRPRFLLNLITSLCPFIENQPLVEDAGGITPR
jgi:hypothetical protein